MSQHPANKPVIGLLGLPGSGKSHVASVFAELGAGVVDADAIAHELLNEAGVLEQLRQWWGTKVLDREGRADRATISQIVFKDSDQLARLEQLLHPRVRTRRAQMHGAYQGDDSIRAIIEDSPLLIEQGLDRDCDTFVFVDAPRADRLSRLALGRGWDEAELDRRENLQTPLDIKRQRAHYVIENGGVSDIHSQARQTLTDILRTV